MCSTHISLPKATPRLTLQEGFGRENPLEFARQLSRAEITNGSDAYWRDGSTLRLDQGVFFLKRKAIPSDRITDVMLVQGPLMLWYGIWAIHIQTAGMGGHAVAEGILYGIDDPEGVRDELLRTRDEAASRYRA